MFDIDTKRGIMTKLENMEGFSARLRDLRKERNLRQKDLATVLGLAQTTIANYEQNTRFPDEATLKKIVDYFNTSLDFLLGRSEQTHGAIGVQEAARLDAGSPPPLSPLAQSYLDSLLASDKRGAVELILSECEKGKPVREIYVEVFQPVLEEVGYRWEIAEADVYEEHFISSITVSLMAQVMQYARPHAVHRGTFLSVVGSGERHEIGLRMVSDFLEIAGWESVYLGVNIPSRNIIKAVEDRQANLLGISVTMQYNLNGAANLVSSLRSHRSCRDLRILVGGRAFQTDPELWKQMGADAYAASAEEAVVTAERLL